jgi:hypothetical protein
MSSSRVRRRSAAAIAGLAVAASSLVVGSLADASSAAVPDRSASTAVDSTYLQDTLGLPAQTVVETVTYDRFQWLLQQPGQLAFLVGSTNDAGFPAKVVQADTAAKAAGASRIYWFDPNLSGYAGAKNLDTRNPSGITSIAPAAQAIYARTWQNVLAQYIGNGLKATVNTAAGTITTAPDDTVVNDATNPLWDYRAAPAAPPVGNSDDVFFVYDKDHTDASQADKILVGVNLSTAADTAASLAAAFTTVGGPTIDTIDQFQWWKAENNRRLALQADAVRYGSTVLDDTDNANGWHVRQLTYPELIHLLDVNDSDTKNFALLFGGTWCPNTRAVIKDVNKQAAANDVQVYNWDTVLDGGVVGGGTTSSSNPIQVRNNAIFTTGGVTTTNYAPSFLYGDLVRKYLRNIVTEYDPNTGTRVLFYPGGDTTAAPDVVRKLQVPFLINYQRGTAANPSGTAIKRQWIQQNVDTSTGLPTFKEYMTQFWYSNPQGTRIGLSTAQLPLELPIPAEPLTAPDSAFLTAAELADSTTTADQKAALVTPRRAAVSQAVAQVAFATEAITGVRNFFGGLPGGVVSTQTVTAPKAAYGTAPKVTVAIANPYGRVPAGQATLTVGGAIYPVTVAQNSAVFTVAKLVPGSYPYSVAYAGDDQIAGFTKTGALIVAKAKVTKATGAAVKVPTSTLAGSYKVSVTTPAGLLKATGKVTLTFVQGKVTKKLIGTVTAGSVTVTVPKSARGTWRVSVAYGGDARYLPAVVAGKVIVVTK